MAFWVLNQYGYKDPRRFLHNEILVEKINNAPEIIYISVFIYYITEDNEPRRSD